MSVRFVNIERETEMMLPVDMREWLPKDHKVSASGHSYIL